MLMNAGYPVAVTAAAGKPHKPEVDTPESVVAMAEYAEDFIGVFSINYAAMQYKTRNDQLNQLDGDQARMDIGREELRVYRKGAEETAGDREEVGKGIRLGHGSARRRTSWNACVRARLRRRPMKLAFQAALVVQMANLSLKQGRRLKWNAAAGRVENG